MEKADSRILSAVSRLSNMIRRRLAAAAADSYSGAESKVLFFLLDHKEEKIVQKDIEAEFGLRPPSASQLMAKMEKNGLITRRISGDDRRCKYIAPTKKALSYETALMNAQNELICKMIGELDREQVSHFCEMAEKMVDNLMSCTETN